MITIQINTFTKIKNYIDGKYDDLFYYNSFKSGTTLSITDENNQIYGLINDGIDIPLFIPNKDLGIASETFMKYLEYKGINSCDIQFNDEVKTIYQNKSKLKIERYDIDDIENFDFTLILIKIQPVIHKGKKLQQNYVDKNGDIIVTKYYHEIIGDRIIFGKISTNRLIGMSVEIIWWDENNEIGLTKNIKVKEFSRQEEGERYKSYRDRQLANLKGLSIGTDAEPVVNYIYEYYNDLIYEYITQGNDKWLLQLESEIEQPISTYLAIDIPNINSYDLDLDDFYVVDNIYYYDVPLNYDNCMIKMHQTGIGYKIIFDGEEHVGLVTDIQDDFYTIQLDFIPIETNSYTIIYTSSIKDYIVHEINPTIY